MKTIFGCLNVGINDEQELSDYMELTFGSLIGDKVKNADNLLYRVGLNISNNDISKAELNKKIPRENKHEIIFLNKMFIDNVVLTGVSTKSRKKTTSAIITLLLGTIKKNYNNNVMRIMCIAEGKHNEVLTKANINKFQHLTNSKLKNERDKLKSMDF